MNTPHLAPESAVAHAFGLADDASAHIASCPECRDRVEALRRNRRAIAKALEETPARTSRKWFAIEAIAACLIFGLVGFVILRKPPAPVVTPGAQDADIAKWIADLGSDRLETRDSASKKLRETGRRAKAALEVAKTEDPEVRSRISMLLHVFRVAELREIAGTDADGRIMMWLADGKASVALGQPHEKGIMAPLSWSSDGRRIAYRFNQSVCVLDVESGEETVIASGNISSMPIWSPDGDSLAYQLDASLHLFSVSTGKEQALATTAIPLLWNTETTIYAWHNPDIVRYDLPPTVNEPTETRISPFHAYPTAARHGKGIYFLGTADGQRGFSEKTHPLQYLDPGTGKITTLASGIGPDRMLSAPAVSPDGAWIAFLRARDLDGTDICLVRSDGRDERRIGEGRLVTWSPDSRRIAFQPPGGGTIVLDISTGVRTELLELGLPAWCPIPPEK